MNKVFNSTAFALSVFMATGFQVAMSQSSSTWTTKASMTNARSGTRSVAYGGKLYVCGGWTGSAPTAHLEEYDPLTNSWTTKSSMPTARYGHGFVELGGLLYSIGGSLESSGQVFEEGETPYLKSVEVFDPSTNSWSSRTSMQEVRYSPSVGAVAGKIYACGGLDLSSVEEYHPASDSWTYRQPIPAAYHEIGATVVENSLLYVMGGQAASFMSDVQCFDPSTNSWSVKQPIPSLRSSATAGALNGEIYVVGGNFVEDSNPLTLATMAIYNPPTNAWRVGPSMSVARGGCAAAVIGSALYVVGGNISGTSTQLSTLEAFTLVPPISNAGTDQTVECASHSGTTVSLNGSASSDPDGTPLTFQWKNSGGSVVGSTSTVQVSLGPGLHTFTLKVSKGVLESTDQVAITVQDTTAPVITQPADIQVPCNVNLLVPVTYSFTVSDACDPNPTAVASPASGSGFPVGTTTVTVTATDSKLNSSTRTFNVIRAALSFTGFHSPIGGADATGGSFSSPLKAFKLKSTLPVKFSASCGSEAVTTGVHTLAVTKYSGETTSAEPIDATPQDAATTGNQFKLTDGQWHFNLDAEGTGMSTGIWLLTATLSDGSKHAVWIQIK